MKQKAVIQPDTLDESSILKREQFLHTEVVNESIRLAEYSSF